MPANPIPPPPRPSTGGVKGVLTRKVGPAPVYLWVIAAIIVYVVYRRFAASRSSGATGFPAATPADTTGSLTTGAGGGMTDSGAGGGGLGSVADQLNAELLAQLGAQNADLTNALLSNNQTFAGLSTGLAALYTPQATPQASATVPSVAALLGSATKPSGGGYTPSQEEQVAQSAAGSVGSVAGAALGLFGFGPGTTYTPSGPPAGSQPSGPAAPFSNVIAAANNAAAGGGAGAGQVAQGAYNLFHL